MKPFAMTLVAAILISAGLAPAQDQPAADTAVKVLEIKGKARYRTGPQAEWQPLAMDSAVNLYSEFQTAAHSHVKLQVGPNSQVVLKGLGTLTIAGVAKDEQAGVIRTRLGQKYGRVDVEVQHIGEMRNDYTIATPGMVLAIKGSGGEVSSYGPTWYVNWQHGNADQTTGGGTSSLVGGDQTNQNNTNPTQNQEQQTNLNNNFYPGLGAFMSNNDKHYGYGGNGTQQLNDIRTGNESNSNNIDTINNQNPPGGGEGDDDDGGGPPPPLP